jgi:hypothetical protein
MSGIDFSSFFFCLLVGRTRVQNRINQNKINELKRTSSLAIYVSVFCNLEVGGRRGTVVKGEIDTDPSPCSADITEYIQPEISSMFSNYIVDDASHFLVMYKIHYRLQSPHCAE